MDEVVGSNSRFSVQMLSCRDMSVGRRPVLSVYA